ncbi:MAG: formylglycine-generating enzyme family protein [Leptolyngbyaceae bacterium]|nr:formylglycine-generating enzyme family protein [Leptolyngbyaceae bacterium]
MLADLLAIFKASGLLGDDVGEEGQPQTIPLLNDEDILDALWLALQLPSGQADLLQSLPTLAPETDARKVSEGPEPIPSGFDDASDVGLPAANAYLESGPTKSDGVDPESLKDEGLPIKVQEAPALREARDIGRALRPLRRKVPSPSRQMIDEAATVDQIARQDIWVPVLQPALERWLDLELVIEASPFSFIWQSTLKDFRHILERQGAFRTVRSWTLKQGNDGPRIWPRHQDWQSGSGRSLDELISASGRSVIMVVSDCRSPLWSGEVWESTDTASPPMDWYGWLHRLSHKMPTAVVQLLPEWLWPESALDLGYGLSVHARSRGVPNSRLVMDDVPLWERVEAPHALLLPVMPLLASALKQWAQVIAGRSDYQASARLFDRAWVGDPHRPRRSGSRFGVEASAAERVEYFFATASPLAQRLAMMMAVVPVDLSVVHLIQETLLPESNYVHVAEVYSSGLLASMASSDRPVRKLGWSTAAGTPPQFSDDSDGDRDGGEDGRHYAFVPGVREILNQLTSVEDAKAVLHELSQAIAARLGLPPIKHFSALLLPQKEWDQAQQDAILPFARITTGVLYQLGGDFAALADVVVEGVNEWVMDSDLFARFPPLQPLEFDTVQLQIQIPTTDIGAATPAVQTIDFEYVTLEQQQQRWVAVRHPAQARRYVEPLTNNVGLEMVLIPAGTFIMGEGSQEHEVSVSAFYMGKYTITQSQWKVVAAMDAVNQKLDADPSRFKGDNLPVESVSWNDAVEFCQRLSRYTEHEYRLPSEAEWEYACRAGTTTAFHFGETVTTDVANYNGNYTYNNGPKGRYREKTIAVGSLNAPNAFGLHDMHGNVWEWCEDDDHASYANPPTDGSAWVDTPRGSSRILRGGSWGFDPDYCRSAYRDDRTPGNRNLNIGFRVVVSAPGLSSS